MNNNGWNNWFKETVWFNGLINISPNYHFLGWEGTLDMKIELLSTSEGFTVTEE